jgi:hypothetical protein
MRRKSRRLPAVIAYHQVLELVQDAADAILEHTASTENVASSRIVLQLFDEFRVKQVRFRQFRGEGIFLRIREEVLLNWQAKPEVQQLEQEFFESHKAWGRLRKLEPVLDGFPGIRLVLLHSLSHALMRQIVLDCGYRQRPL